MFFTVACGNIGDPGGFKNPSKCQSGALGGVSPPLGPPEAPKFGIFQSWAPEGCLAGDSRAGFPGICGRSRPPEPPLDRRAPAPHINFHDKSAPQANSKAISRHPKESSNLTRGRVREARGLATNIHGAGCGMTRRSVPTPDQKEGMLRIPSLWVG